MSLMSLDLVKQRIMVTGGSGFLGKRVVAKLHERGARDVFVVRQAEYDLVDRAAGRRAISAYRPDVILHLAAVVGGIGANRDNPGRFYFENLMMGVQLMEEARLAGVRKLVAVGTICAYPKHTPIPFREDDLRDGSPEETNAPYGPAKKMLLVPAQAYRQQYGFNAVHPLPVNLHGPEDTFDPRPSHVIPALIKKCVDARQSGVSAIEAWGDGSASRELLYVDDAADGLVLIAERHDSPEPINLGSGREITIRDLIHLIAELTELTGRIEFDPSKPNGQPRRCPDVSRAERELGFKARTDFRTGLRKTIAWYEQARRTAAHAS
jgi:GDP-L-fucose synthase